MTDLAATPSGRPTRSGNDAAHAPVLVTGVKPATHVRVVRQHIDQLAQQGVIERRGGGLFDQDASRLRYLSHLARRASAVTAQHGRYLACRSQNLCRCRSGSRNGVASRCGALSTKLTKLYGWPAALPGRTLACDGEPKLCRMNCGPRLRKRRPCSRMNTPSHGWTTTHDDRFRDQQREVVARIERAARSSRG
jgi:hypothetical protein